MLSSSICHMEPELIVSPSRTVRRRGTPGYDANCCWAPENYSSNLAVGPILVRAAIPGPVRMLHTPAITQLSESGRMLAMSSMPVNTDSAVFCAIFFACASGTNCPSRFPLAIPPSPATHPLLAGQAQTSSFVLFFIWLRAAPKSTLPAPHIQPAFSTLRRRESGRSSAGPRSRRECPWLPRNHRWSSRGRYRYRKRQSL